MMWRIATGVLALLLLAAAVPAVRYLRQQPAPLPPPVHVGFVAPDGAGFTVGDSTLDAAFSHDGRTVAFAAVTGGRVSLWRQPLDGRPAPIPGTEGAAFPAWKPGDGVIAFAAGGMIRQAALDDGRVRDLVAAPAAAGLSWLADGSLVFAPSAAGPLKRLAAGTVSDATALQEGDRAHAWPMAAPGGFTYLALRADGTRVVRWRRGEAEVELTRASGHGVVIDDVLLFARDGVLLGQRLDAERGALTGRAVALAPEVGVTRGGRAAFAGTGRVLLAGPASSGARELYWADLDGTRLESILEPGDLWQVRLSPRGDLAAVTALDPLLRTLDVYAVPLSSPASARRLSLSLGADSDPTFAPDGREVLFRSDGGGNPALIARRVEASGTEERRVPTTLVSATPTDWRDNRVLVHAADAGTGRDLWVLDTATGAAQQLTRGGFNEWDARWSPDGAAIAYVSDEGGAANVYVEPFPGDGTRVRVSFAGGARPQWQRDGRALFFIRGDAIVRAPRRDDSLSFLPPETVIRAAGLEDFAIGRDGRRLAILAGAVRAERPAIANIGWRATPDLSQVPANR